jgi:hypothetical protein
MRKIAMLSCLFLAAASATPALARHSHYMHHRMHAVQRTAPLHESQTSVGGPDCHVQGRFSRIANHCPPEAIGNARSF